MSKMFTENYEKMENLPISEITDNSFASKILTDFKHEVIKDALRSQFVNPKNKITDEAVELVNEITKILVIEASLRAAKQASKENKTTITLEHVENILPQLILDFS